MSKRLSEYFASFDQFDKPLFVLPTTSGSISIALFATVTGIPVGITSASFSLAFSLSTGPAKNWWKQQEIKRNGIIKMLW